MKPENILKSFSIVIGDFENNTKREIDRKDAVKRVMKLLLENISTYASVICIISMFLYPLFHANNTSMCKLFFHLTHSSQMAVCSCNRGTVDEKKFPISDKKCL